MAIFKLPQINKMLHVVCYISNSIYLWSPKELDRFFKYVQQENDRKNISGILLYNDGTFVQVLEGEANEINALFTSIMRDRRHNHLTIMMDRSIEERIFGGYETRSISFGDVQEVKKIKSRILLPRASQYTKSVWAVLSPFFSLRQIGMKGYGV